MSEAAARFQTEQAGTLPGLLGFEWVDARYLHAATVVALSDTACGLGCRISLPDGAAGFATAELKANFIGTAREGTVTCDAALVHAGRSIQLWDATVKSEITGKTIALFRCTQMLLYQR